jgi:hypothetical protein
MKLGRVLVSTGSEFIGLKRSVVGIVVWGRASAVQSCEIATNAKALS